MATIVEKRPSAVNAVLGDSEEEVFGVEVLVNHVHPALLMREALALTAFDEARKLVRRTCQYLEIYEYI